MPTRNLGRVWAVLLTLNVVTAIFAEPGGDTSATQTPARPVIDVYISTGDNLWMGQGLPIDSKASIEATFEVLKEVGMRRVYWRGLQEATSLETLQELPENTRIRPTTVDLPSRRGEASMSARTTTPTIK